MSDQQQQVEAIRDHVKAEFLRERSGHDWWHMWRVWKMARHLHAKEGGDLFVIELAALLHDIADHKFHDGDRDVAPRLARELLEKHDVPAEVIDQVVDIIPKVSYSGSGGKKNMETVEGKIVQDADRLDAVGAIATARVFMYGGYDEHLMFVPPEDDAPDAEKERAISCIQHFDDKLLKLRDLMNTETARSIADERHAFMEQYLEQFNNEWYFAKNA